VFVDGLTQAEVHSFEEAMEVFSKGENLRTTAETKFNERSSRSHAIFSVTVEHEVMAGVGYRNRKEQDDESPAKIRVRKRSVINFVDLAGSERQFGSDVDRLKETCQINKSLVVLSSVINNMGEGGKKFMHVRDSK
jgi:hypothetical protein